MKDAAPIIKRKKVVAGDGHHGGAWKVAYADFVTAMMAFFLLMWLLNATTEQQRKGLADYFSPDIPLARISGGGDGLLAGRSATEHDTQAEAGRTASPGLFGDAGHLADEAWAQEQAALQAIEDRLLGRGGESLLSDEALRHVVTRLTDEGLVIEVFALPGSPLWDGAADPRPVTREIVAVVAEVAQLVTNPVAVGAHVPARPVVLAQNPVWHLSMTRADAARRLLGEGGMEAGRFARVTGHADRSPAVADPAASRNDRLEVTLLRRVPR
jgi:chemotaxis protein MotB